MTASSLKQKIETVYSLIMQGISGRYVKPAGGIPRSDLEPGALHYALVSPAVSYSTTDETNDTASATLQDRASNIVTLGSGVANATFTLPVKTTGKMRDFFLRLILTGSEPPVISFVEPEGGAPDFDVADDDWADFERGVNVVCFTETSQEAAQA